MAEIKDRLNEIKDYYRMSNRAFGDAVGQKPAATNNYMNGTKEPSLGFISKVLSTFMDISAEWLMRGDGPMLIKERGLSDGSIAKELAEIKVKLLVQEGITKELRDIILEKNGGKIG